MGVDNKRFHLKTSITRIRKWMSICSCGSYLNEFVIAVVAEIADEAASEELSEISRGITVGD